MFSDIVHFAADGFFHFIGSVCLTFVAVGYACYRQLCLLVRCVANAKHRVASSTTTWEGGEADMSNGNINRMPNGS